MCAGTWFDSVLYILLFCGYYFGLLFWIGGWVLSFVFPGGWIRGFWDADSWVCIGGDLGFVVLLPGVFLFCGCLVTDRG